MINSQADCTVRLQNDLSFRFTLLAVIKYLWQNTFPH